MNVFLIPVDHELVYFISCNKDVPLFRLLGDKFNFLQCENFAKWIVRVVEQILFIFSLKRLAAPLPCWIYLYSYNNYIFIYVYRYRASWTLTARSKQNDQRWAYDDEDSSRSYFYGKCLHKKVVCRERDKKWNEKRVDDKMFEDQSIRGSEIETFEF